MPKQCKAEQLRDRWNAHSLNQNAEITSRLLATVCATLLTALIGGGTVLTGTSQSWS